MALHPLAERFADVADAYERARPEYAPAVAGAIAAELGVSQSGRVLDLAAGTGKLSRALLGAGLDVVAVEPIAQLRRHLAAAIGAERVVEGLAEAIPLPDRAVEAVTVGDAFHWFNQPRALGEIRRVLRPGGGLAVLTTVPDWGGALWAQEVGSLIMELRPEHPHFDGPPWQDAVRAAASWSEPREIRVSTRVPARPELVADHVSSMSWVAALPEDERAATLARIDEVVMSGDTPAELGLHFVIGLASLA
jgi:SAM-dependent methyltransferase